MSDFYINVWRNNRSGITHADTFTDISQCYYDILNPTPGYSYAQTVWFVITDGVWTFKEIDSFEDDALADLEDVHHSPAVIGRSL